MNHLLSTNPRLSLIYKSHLSLAPPVSVQLVSSGNKTRTPEVAETVPPLPSNWDSESQAGWELLSYKRVGSHLGLPSQDTPDTFMFTHSAKMHSRTGLVLGGPSLKRAFQRPVSFKLYEGYAVLRT